MKRNWITKLAAAALTLSLVGCGNLTPGAPSGSQAAPASSAAASSAAPASSTAPAAPAGDLTFQFDAANIGERTLKLSTTASPGSALANTAHNFAERVSELSGGKMTVDVYEGSALGSEAQNLEALTSGTLDIAIIAVEFYVNSIPQLGALILPYMYSDYDQVQKVVEGPAGQYASEQMLNVAKVKNLGYYVMAFRNMYTTKEIKTVDDLVGVKMRVPESPLYVETFKMMGAAPTPMPMGEVYTAIDTGVVAGLENTPDTCLNNSFFEVAKFFNVTKHLNAPTTISMSNKVFESLNQDEQNLLLQAGLDASHFGVKQTKELDEGFQKQLKEKGMTFVESDTASMKAKIDYTVYPFMQSEEAKQLFKLVQDNL